MEGRDEERFLGIGMVMPDDEISFSSSQNYCVCVVDIVDSTDIILRIGNPLKLRKLISTFINSMAILVRNFSGAVIKNVGDSLIFYFPETSNSNNKDAFKKVFECFRAILDARPIINTKLYQEGLPPLNYRISGDYGRVELARSNGSRRVDLFGSTVTLCSKINRIAQKNGIIIGGDLYRIMHFFKLERDGQRITEIGGYGTGLKFSYSLYRIEMTGIDTSNPFNRRISNSERGKPKSGKKDLLKIMIVDDEPDALETFKSFLNNTKYEVDIFTNGEKALNKLASVELDYYDLLISDIRMTPINGLEFYERVRRINPQIKILFASALDAREELLSLFTEVKSHNILQKPVVREEFIRAIEEVLS